MGLDFDNACYNGFDRGADLHCRTVDSDLRRQDMVQNLPDLLHNASEYRRICPHNHRLGTGQPHSGPMGSLTSS